MIRFVVYIALFAAVVYAFFWLLERRKGGAGGGPGGPGRPGGGRGPGGRGPGGPGPRGPLGPDDDEDFLRELDRRQRHRHTEPPEDS